MPPFLSNDSNSDWVKATYPFVGSSLDKSLPPHQGSGPFLLSGVDGREFGSIIRFPGFIKTTIGDVPIAGDPAPKYIARVNLNKGSEGHELRGWVILRRHVIFSYYDSELRAMYAKILRYNFGGLQLNSDSFRATSSNVALYLSWCGQAIGNGESAAGQRHLRVSSNDFFKAGDTIWIERDTTRTEEAVIDSYTSTEHKTSDGDGGWLIDYDILLRTNLKYTHGSSGAMYQIEGGSGNVGMTVVTHDGDDFLIEQAGPLYEDGEVDFEVNMIGGTTTAAPTTTTTTVDLLTSTPKINSPIYAGDTELSGAISAFDPAGPTGVEMRMEFYDTHWTEFYNPSLDQSRSFTANEDRTWTRAQHSSTVKEGRIFRVKTRLPDVGDGTPGLWTFSEEVKTLAALPDPRPELCTINGDLVAGQTELLISFPGATPATGAEAQPVVQSQDGDHWIGLTRQQDITPGLNILTVAALKEGRIYSVRHRDSSTGEWSGDSSGDDGRLVSISQTASKPYSTLASINEPVAQGDAKLNGFIIDGGAETVGNIVTWNGERWHLVTKTLSTGQFGPATFSFDLPSSVKTGDIISFRTRLVDGGAWSGDLYGDDMDQNNRLMDISAVVQ